MIPACRGGKPARRHRRRARRRIEPARAPEPRRFPFAKNSKKPLQSVPRLGIMLLSQAIREDGRALLRAATVRMR